MKKHKQSSVEGNDLLMMGGYQISQPLDTVQTMKNSNQATKNGSLFKELIALVYSSHLH